MLTESVGQPKEITFTQREAKILGIGCAVVLVLEILLIGRGIWPNLQSALQSGYPTWGCWLVVADFYVIMLGLPVFMIVKAHQSLYIKRVGDEDDEVMDDDQEIEGDAELSPITIAVAVEAVVHEDQGDEGELSPINTVVVEAVAHESDQEGQGDEGEDRDHGTDPSDGTGRST